MGDTVKFSLSVIRQNYEVTEFCFILSWSKSNLFWSWYSERLHPTGEMHDLAESTRSVSEGQGLFSFVFFKVCEYILNIV